MSLTPSPRHLPVCRRGCKVGLTSQMTGGLLPRVGEWPGGGQRMESEVD